ncbi:pentatricopeptide repeat domain-containing protein [Colletotrichum kahawae]|uniref:Pentatricopeptide repeat domain-containing protein n=1 Tax=Colletotrichum kahawae TaxID=34407 RepID=A0AAD9Y5V0_COLKA|nr:pentatricopeptide repeat domain-containing protein [Colletotrichum kahawae]
MQALWSRAGQAPHCGCKACFKAAGGMVRQSATRVTPRKPTFGEMFTACYTGIMASAAVLDAKAKDERRLRLEEEIAQAKLELDNMRRSVPQDVMPGEAPPGSFENRYKGALWAHKPQKGEIAEFLDSLSHTDGRLLRKNGEIKRLLKELGFENSTDAFAKTDDASYTDPFAKLVETNYTEMDNFLLDEERLQWPELRHRVPKNMVQLQITETNMGSLVDRIVEDSRNILGPSDWNDLREEVGQLRQGNLPYYERQTDMIAVKENSAQLNSIMGSVFASTEYDQRTKIGKICYNLLASSQPPTIFTYNTLITGFHRNGLQPLAERVVRSFYNARVEPTRKTLVCLLNHFKETGDARGFFGAIHRMTGKDPRGICIRRRAIEEVEEDDGFLIWAAMKNVAVNNDYVTERAWFDLDMFTAIVHGLLRFDYVRQAAAAFAVGLKHGITFSAQTTLHLLEQVTYALDTTAAQQLLLAIEMRPRLISEAFREPKHQQDIQGRIQNLIDICLLDREVSSVVPWLQVRESQLPAEMQRRGLRIVSIMQQTKKSHVKIRCWQQDLNTMKSKIFSRNRSEAGYAARMKEQAPAQAKSKKARKKAAQSTLPATSTQAGDIDNSPQGMWWEREGQLAAVNSL